jgi:hypothetical protein
VDLIVKLANPIANRVDLRFRRMTFHRDNHLPLTSVLILNPAAKQKGPLVSEWAPFKTVLS